LIVSSFSPKHAQCSLIIESPDDLWTLRRLISKGDVVVTRSSRVVKKEDEYSRPDKGERVKVTLALRVESVRLDSSVGRVRVKGEIIESSDDSITKAGSHSVTLSPGHPLTLRKQAWRQVDTSLVESARSASSRFLLVAIDRREAGVGTLAGAHLKVLATVESGLGGKMGDEQSSRPYFSKVESIIRSEAREGDVLAVAGPGHTKNTLVNGLQGLRVSAVHLIEGFDLAGPDGLRALVKSEGFRKVAAGSALVELEEMVLEAVRRISTGDPRVAYAFAKVAEAAEAGAVESCAVSDDVFSMGLDEDALVRVLNGVEERGGKVYLADSTLETGRQVSSFGGILALLRYGLRAY
jgi:protein pelota